jgi:flagellar basal body-associated protein FliL
MRPPKLLVLISIAIVVFAAAGVGVWRVRSNSHDQYTVKLIGAVAPDQIVQKVKELTGKL